MTALALPRLKGVPLQYSGRDNADAWCTPALLGLLEGGALLPEDAQPTPASPAELLKRVLQRHWNAVTAGERIFVWNLGANVFSGQWHPVSDKPDAWWLLIGDGGSETPAVPQLFIGPAFERLEAVRAGLGQTVLAVLYDALRYLPNVLTPQTAFEFASVIHWHGYDSEQGAIEFEREMGAYENPEEAEEAYEGPRRDAFFEHMPEWAVFPKRVLSDRQVRRAAHTDDFAARVTAAVDAIHAHVCATHVLGGYADCSTRDIDGESVCWSAILIWHPEDFTLRLADDFIQYVTQAEFIDAATAVAFPIDGPEAAEWLLKMRANGELARRVENLLDLLAAQNPLRQQVQIAV
ncbi:PRTRC system protein F [Ralstonia mannitolilytica]|uniref:PRTRC system protein F n=1 Tax=Ralstonia mannitolilytica TaxID=105219 RepID=UPI0028F58AD6|nr:PRTRC system protein F [Ralstonia mannitolilytica]CAJ0740879.1 hypothetical protein R76696_03186 [Ralstonia mannitolilytica]